MHLHKEVETKAPRSAVGEILFGTKLTMLVVGLAAGLPLGMLYAFQVGMHREAAPVVVTISSVRVLDEPSMDALSGADWCGDLPTMCRDCPPNDLSLSDMELCRTDDPSCRWSYTVDREGRVRRVPNRRAGRFLPVPRPSSLRVRSRTEREASPAVPFPDTLLYESF